MKYGEVELSGVEEWEYDNSSVENRDETSDMGV